MVNFLFSAYFRGYFCFHCNGKGQINTRRIHLVHCSKNTNKKNLVKTISFFSILGGGGQNSLLMHVALCLDLISLGQMTLYIRANRLSELGSVF